MILNNILKHVLCVDQLEGGTNDLIGPYSASSLSIG